MMRIFHEILHPIIPLIETRQNSLKNKFILGIAISTLVISTVGAVGNGAVIWLLGFRIKRNPFSTYILNLAVADFGVLLLPIVYSFIYWLKFATLNIKVFFYLSLLMYTTSQFLLTAISIDRCVAVFCPLWHRCKRPPHLSIIVCALIWVLSVLLTGITYTLQFLKLYHVKIGKIGNVYQFIVNAVLCLPVMTIATVALFIKVCVTARQHRRGRLLTIVLLTLLFFLLFALPLNVIYIVFFFVRRQQYIVLGAYLLACLNSSVNPVIYFLVGRQWKTRQKESMKTILQNVFKEAEGCGEEIPV